MRVLTSFFLNELLLDQIQLEMCFMQGCSVIKMSGLMMSDWMKEGYTLRSNVFQVFSPIVVFSHQGNSVGRVCCNQ